MTRTTVVLPEELKRRVMRAAQARRVSFATLVRQALARIVESGDSADPLLADTGVFTGKAPAKLASEHDRHLYG